MYHSLIVRAALAAIGGRNSCAAVLFASIPSRSHAIRRGFVGVRSACAICCADVGALGGWTSNSGGRPYPMVAVLMRIDLYTYGMAYESRFMCGVCVRD